MLWLILIKTSDGFLLSILLVFLWIIGIYLSAKYHKTKLFLRQSQNCFMGKKALPK